MDEEVDVATDKRQYYRFIVCLTVKAEGKDDKQFPLECSEFRLAVVNVSQCRVAERFVVSTITEFADAISQVDDFLASRNLAFPDVVFLTESRWQLDTCIKWEAACKEVNLQHSHWCFHLDARVECLKSDLGSKLNHTISKLGIPSDLSPEDTLAKITISLLQRGHHFKSPQSASNTLLSTIQKQWMYGGNEADEVGQAIHERSAVMLTGIPRKARSEVTYSSVSEFVSPIELSEKDIVIDPNPEAACVQVYFILPDSESWQLLLTYYNKDFLSYSDIDILPVPLKEVELHGWKQPPPAPLGPPASLSLYPSQIPPPSPQQYGDYYSYPPYDYYECPPQYPPLPHHLALQSPIDELSSCVVILRGLPFATNEIDVAQFLEGIRIVNQGIHLLFTSDEKPCGECFVEVYSSRDVQLALAVSGKKIGHRYIEVARSSKGQLLKIMEQAIKVCDLFWCM
eukprot:TRINITY_DN1884_c1_g1_i4.p1 TRINITY_DN1884_c1_g1~~TRINITY_DN1884_c1_g1_i4.p1  ORF type:complete len:456 (+),score=63.00 TRINITY_DN1884_c1_g1_i4:73-1440(+)